MAFTFTEIAPKTEHGDIKTVFDMVLAANHTCLVHDTAITGPNRARPAVIKLWNEDGQPTIRVRRPYVAMLKDAGYDLKALGVKVITDPVVAKTEQTFTPRQVSRKQKEKELA